MAPVLQWPVDDKCEAKKHWVIPAWFVAMAGARDPSDGINMHITWEDVDIHDLIVKVPVLTNTRALKEGDLLKRPFVERATSCPTNKRRRVAA